MSSSLSNIRSLDSPSSRSSQQGPAKKQCSVNLSQASQPGSSLALDDLPDDLLSVIIRNFGDSRNSLQNHSNVSKRWQEIVISIVKQLNSTKLQNICKVITAELKARLITEIVKNEFPSELNNISEASFAVIEKSIADRFITGMDNTTLAAIEQLAIDLFTTAYLRADQSKKIAAQIKTLVIKHFHPPKEDKDSSEKKDEEPSSHELKAPFTTINNLFTQPSEQSKNAFLIETFISQMETGSFITNKLNAQASKTDHLQRLCTSIEELTKFYQGLLRNNDIGNLKKIKFLLAIGMTHIKNVLRILSPQILENVKSRKLEWPMFLKMF